jgi:hypothetical protein
MTASTNLPLSSLMQAPTQIYYNDKKNYYTLLIKKNLLYTIDIIYNLNEDYSFKYF